MPAASPVAFGAITCPSCGAALPPHALDAMQEQMCPGCRMALRGRIFPAWSAPAPGASAVSERALEGEAVCFFHPANRAALPCDVCGRFICSLCDLPVGSRHLCPVCLGKGLGKEKLPEIIPRRFLWAGAAFWIGLLPIVFFFVLWPVTIICGPAAIVLALMGWKRPGSLVRGQQHGSAVLGILFGLVQLGVWISAIALFAAARSR